MTSIDLLGPANAPGSVTIRPTEYRTFGTIDTWFRDCTDPLIDDGTEYQAAFFNAMLANVRSIVRGNGVTGGGADVVTQNNLSDDLIWQACQHLYQRGQPSYADDTGIANQVIIALSPAPAELKKGMQVRVKIAADNTDAVTLTCNATVKDVKTVAGQPLQKGMLSAGQMANFEFDGINWQLTSVWSEKVVFTPTLTLAGAAIGSLANGVYGQHNLSLVAASNMTPVVGANSFQLPSGKYVFAVNSLGVVHNNVINQTQCAQGIRLSKNGAIAVQTDIEATQLVAGQNATMYPQFAAVASVIDTDVLTLYSYAAVTSAGDFNGASSVGASLSAIRVGN